MEYLQNQCTCVAGSDNKMFIWNVGTAEVITEIDLPDIALSASWNWDGSKLVATCKDKKIRLFNPRTGDIDKVITTFSCIYNQIIFFVFLFSFSDSCLNHRDQLVISAGMFL